MSVKLKINYQFLVITLFLLFNSLYAHQIHLTNPKKNWLRFFEHIVSLCQLDTFIESGTYLGDTIAQAISCFPCIHSIELSHDLYLNASKRFSKNKNVTLHHGESTHILTSLLPRLAQDNRRVLFWLDAHGMNTPSTTIGTEYTPILAELLAIFKNRLSASIILIDDIRLFGTILDNKRIANSGDAHYPPLCNLCHFLDCNQNVAYVLLGDILFIYDVSLKLTFSPLIKACTTSRFFDGANFQIEDVLEAERIIAQAEGEEKVALYELYEAFSMKWRTWHNRSPHYNIWYGLMLQHENNHSQACEQFQEAIDLGYNHWRIFFYLAESLLSIGRLQDATDVLNQLLKYNPQCNQAHSLLQLMQKGNK